MDVYAQIAEKIIRQQETIIGPVAVEQAEQVPNLSLDWAKHTVAIKGDGSKVVDDLVGKYRALFGRISVEVCREAAEPLMKQLPDDKLPKTLS